MKKILAFAVAGVTLLMGAGMASAATISSPLFSNGDTTIDAVGGSTVNGTFTLTVGPGEVVEWLRSQADTQPFSDTSVGGTLGYQEGVYTNVPFSVKVPPNTGNYNVNEQGAGIYGGIRAINGGDNVVVGPANVGMVRVVANGSTGSTTVGGTDAMSQLSAAIMALLAKLTAAPAPTPVASATCAAFSAAMNGAVQGQSQKWAGAPNVKLQGFLLSQGESIPALAAGAAFGFYGPQTSLAVAAFNASNHCN